MLREVDTAEQPKGPSSGSHGSSPPRLQASKLGASGALGHVRLRLKKQPAN